MALQKSITFNGIEVRDAYLKVWSYEGNKEELRVSLAVHPKAGGEMLDNMQFLVPHNLSGDNPIKQAYAHLKTLPEFAGAVDC